MPSIETHAILPAKPDRVFALLRQVEDFPQYTRAVESVIQIKEERYRWLIRVAGVEYHWVVDIVESTSPSCLAWKSVTGIANSGRYHLSEVNGGTRLRLVIDYTLNSRFLDHTVGRIAGPIVRRISQEVLARMHERLALPD
jgi:uncharacterized membrane protein